MDRPSSVFPSLALAALAVAGIDGCQAACSMSDADAGTRVAVWAVASGTIALPLLSTVVLIAFTLRGRVMRALRRRAAIAAGPREGRGVVLVAHAAATGTAVSWL